MGSVNRGVGLGSLVVLLCLSGGCGSSQYETPEATFQTAKSAVERNDCQGFCRCLTSKGRDEMAADLLLVGGRAQLAAALPGARAEKARDRAKKIKAVLGKHGVNEESMPKIFLSLIAGEEKQKREILKLVEPIADRNAFIADFLRVIVETADDPEMELIEPDARLVDLKTESDTATATFAETRQGKEKTSPIAFEKVDGQWKISQLPRLMN